MYVAAFETIDIIVSAKSKREAKEKVRKKLLKKNILKLIDRRNSGWN